MLYKRANDTKGCVQRPRAPPRRMRTLPRHQGNSSPAEISKKFKKKDGIDPSLPTLLDPRRSWTSCRASNMSGLGGGLLSGTLPDAWLGSGVRNAAQGAGTYARAIYRPALQVHFRQGGNTNPDGRKLERP